MARREVRPELASVPADLSSYDTIYLGFPIWWYTTPMIIRTFLDQNDLTGKTVMPFCTSGGSSLAKAVSEMREAYSSVDVRDGLTVTTSQPSDGASMAADWIGA